MTIAQRKVIIHIDDREFREYIEKADIPYYRHDVSGYRPMSASMLFSEHIQYTEYILTISDEDLTLLVLRFPIEVM